MHEMNPIKETTKRIQSMIMILKYVWKRTISARELLIVHLTWKDSKIQRSVSDIIRENTSSSKI